MEEVKYLGSWIDRTGGDDVDVDRRITAASKAFGALSSCVFRSPAVTKRVKAVVYMVVVLTVLLYGCEAWGLTVKNWKKLQSFHMKCVRTINCISMWHVQEYHISNVQVLERT